jgi:hypothetical protein
MLKTAHMKVPGENVSVTNAIVLEAERMRRLRSMSWWKSK